LIHAEVVNTSWRHDKPVDAETHLELILVTTEFEGKLKANVSSYKTIKLKI